MRREAGGSKDFSSLTRSNEKKDAGEMKNKQVKLLLGKNIYSSRKIEKGRSNDRP